MINVLLLCTSNFTRTPLFVGLLARLVKESGLESNIRFYSRGTFAGLTSRPPDRRIVEHAGNLGLDISGHRTQQVSKAECLEANHIICMDEDSFWFVRTDIPDFPEHRIRLATEYGENLGQREIPEPVTGEGSFEELVAISLKLAPLIFSRLRAENFL